MLDGDPGRGPLRVLRGRVDLIRVPGRVEIMRVDSKVALIPVAGRAAGLMRVPVAVPELALMSRAVVVDTPGAADTAKRAIGAS